MSTYTPPPIGEPVELGPSGYTPPAIGDPVVLGEVTFGFGRHVQPLTLLFDVTARHVQPLAHQVQARHVQPLASQLDVRHVQPLALEIPVTARHVQPLDIELPSVTARHVQPLRLWVQSRHVQPLRSWMQVRHEQPLDIEQPPPVPVPVESRHSQPLAFGSAVTGRHQQPIRFGSAVTSRHVQLIRFAGPVTSRHAQPLRFAGPVTSRHTQPIAFGSAVSARHAQPLAFGTTVSARHAQPLLDSVVLSVRHIQPLASESVPVTASHSQPLTLLDHTPVTARHVQPVAMAFSGFQGLSGQVRVVIDGQTIPVSTASVTLEDGALAWQADITLMRHEDYARFPRDQAFTLDIYGTEYAMLADTRRLSRSRDLEGNPTDTARVSGLSPAVRFDSPRAQTISAVFDVPRSVRSIVEELLGSVTWELVDWTLPAFRFAIERQTPMAAARQLVEAAGGTITSEPDGSILVRHQHPVSVPDYTTTSPDVSLTADAIYDVSEAVTTDRIINRVAIREADGPGRRDRIEFEHDDDADRIGTARLYPDPWRPATLSTSRNGVSLSRTGIVTRTETEVVEFVEGRASVAYPVQSLTSVRWLDDSLGGVVAQGTELTASDGYSLAEIIYTVRAIEYRVSAPSISEPLSAQLLMLTES